MILDKSSAIQFFRVYILILIEQFKLYTQSFPNNFQIGLMQFCWETFCEFFWWETIHYFWILFKVFFEDWKYAYAIKFMVCSAAEELWTISTSELVNLYSLCINCSKNWLKSIKEPLREISIGIFSTVIFWFNSGIKIFSF